MLKKYVFYDKSYDLVVEYLSSQCEAFSFQLHYHIKQISYL